MQVHSTFPLVFVISLKDSGERRRAMAARLDPLLIQYSFFDAVDGSAFDPQALPAYDRLRRRLFFGKDLTAGEMGCLLSHRAVYQYMADHGIPVAVVLEDDALPAPDLPEVVRLLMDTPVPWDVIRFLGRDKVYRNSRAVKKLSGVYTLTRPAGTPGGTYGYTLNLKAARRFLGCMQKNWLPVDILQGFVWRTGLEIFAVRPSPVMPDDAVESTIGDARFDKTVRLSGWQKAAYPLTRLYFKISHAALTGLSWQASRARDRKLQRRSK